MAGIYSYYSVDVPSASRIRKLQRLLDDPKIFYTTIGSQDKSTQIDNPQYVPLREALWMSSQAFFSKSSSAGSKDYRRVWLFTNDDNPNGYSKAEQAKVIQVAKDCAESAIEISLWHLNRSGSNPFDPSIFYEKILFPLAKNEAADDDDEDDDERLSGRMKAGGYEGFDTMMASVRRKRFKKRRMASLFLSFGEVTDNPIDSSTLKLPVVTPMAVHLYKVIQVAKRPLHTWLHSRSNEPLIVQTKYIDGGTGETLNDTQIDTFIDICGYKVPFTHEEMRLAKTGELDMPKMSSTLHGIRILHFVPIHALPLSCNVDTPYFIFPDDKTIAKSSVMFSALLHTLQMKKLVAVVAFTRTTNSVTRAAALIPQIEELDENGCQVSNAGFHLVMLPFLEEYRHSPFSALNANIFANEMDLSVNEKEEKSDLSELDLAMDSLVEDMQLAADFNYSTDIESPALQKFYSILQAVALGEEMSGWTDEMDRMHLQNKTTSLLSSLRVMELSGLEVGSSNAPVTKRAPRVSAKLVSVIIIWF
jgi:ATP-dependent DNA helicase 2 subunit 1